MNNTPVDIVITYVDYNDDNLKNIYETNINKTWYKNRLVNFVQLKYILRSIDKYLKCNINNIYLVVACESQIPKNINLDKIKIILHKDIIPDYLLPTFNSCTIEMFLHKIPNLLEHFIYFNDDTLLINDVYYNNLFDNNGIPIIYAIKKTLNGPYGEMLKNMYNIVFNNDSQTYYISDHGPSALLKSILIEVNNKFKNKINESFTQIRHIKNISQIIFLYYIIYKYSDKQVQSYNLFNSYFSLEYNEYITYNEILSKIYSNNYKSICINYNDKNIDIINIYNVINTICSNKYYNLSQYELYNTYNDNNIHPCILCVVKSEQINYINDFIDYYINDLKFEHIFIIDNNDLEHKLNYNQLILNNYITIIPYHNVIFEKPWGFQIPAYNYALSYIRYTKYNYLFIIDIDEYLILKTDYITVYDLIYHEMICKRKNSIMIKWETYDNNEYLETNENQKLIEKFTHIQNTYPDNNFYNDCFNKYKYHRLNYTKILYHIQDNLYISSPHIIPNDLIGEYHYAYIDKSICSLNHYRFKDLNHYLNIKLNKQNFKSTHDVIEGFNSPLIAYFQNNHFGQYNINDIYKICKKYNYNLSDIEYNYFNQYLANNIILFINDNNDNKQYHDNINKINQLIHNNDIFILQEILNVSFIDILNMIKNKHNSYYIIVYNSIFDDKILNYIINGDLLITHKDIYYYNNNINYLIIHQNSINNLINIYNDKIPLIENIQNNFENINNYNKYIR